MNRRQFIQAAAAAPATLLIGGCQGIWQNATISSRPAEKPAPPGLFHNASEQAGIRFVQGHNGRLPLNILDTIGSGCAFLDYDADGWLDILLVGQPSCALYRNRRDGTFEDVTRAAGLGSRGHWLGCAVGDFDGDGYPDIYVSGYNCGALYHNDGRGAFHDVTAEYGVRPRGMETSCGFLDANGDGRPDLYVARYVRFTPLDRQFCEKNGITTACGPLMYSPDYGTLYINQGGRFVDQTKELGLSAQAGNGLGVAFADYDGAGSAAIALANDEMPGNLFKRTGGTFRDAASDAGTAFDTRGTTYGGMGLDWGDYNNDGRLDLVIGTYMNEPAGLYRNYGGGLFIDEADGAGVGRPTFPWVNFGLRFFDFDNDGYLDLVITNGHVQAGMDALGGAFAYAQPLQLFRNRQGVRFELLDPRAAGPPFDHPIVGRGLAVGDYDNDGGLDVLVVDGEGSALLLHNETPGRGNWIAFDVRGVHGPRNGEGAIIRLEAGSLKLMRNVTTSGSYLSANPSRVHFGLGSSPTAEQITIEWPGGRRQMLPSLAGNRIWKITEGAPPVPLPEPGP